MRKIGAMTLLLGFVAVGMSPGCGDDSCEDRIPFAGAEFNPVTAADAFAGISETSQAVAQTFTVPAFADEPLIQVLLVLTQGASADNGVIRVGLRYTDAMGAPMVPTSSTFALDEIPTSVLPPLRSDQFTAITVDPVSLAPGGTYAIVVEFLSRDGSTDNLDIARVLGVDGSARDPYTEGSGYTGASDIAFVASVDDYFFSTTLVLCLD